MDWNQISNYAARHTHTHRKLGLGEARASGRSARDSRGHGAQTRAQSVRPGPLTGSGSLVRDPGQRAATLWGGIGFSSASGTWAALSDQRGSQRRTAAAIAPEGLSDPAAPPL